jgi:galactonate dehydratase
VRERVRVPISVGERLHTRWDVVPILEQGLADFVMPDVTWTGGISELKKIATLAEAYYVPISPHDAAGPVNLVAGGHVMATVPNFYRIESSTYDLRGYRLLDAHEPDHVELAGRRGRGRPQRCPEDVLRRSRLPRAR